jgi:alpha-L-arabinofuranosidase
MRPNPVIRSGFCVIAALCTMLASSTFAATSGSLTVDVGKPGPPIGPMFYGLMTEEINHSYDGGLYAELIQNRIFQDDPQHPLHWSLIAGSGSAGNIAIDAAQPVNNDALRSSLRLDIKSIASPERVGVANDGFWGIPVWANTKYRASFYARASDGFTGPLNIDIESADGSTIFASASVAGIDFNWKKFDVDLTTGQVPTSTNNRFVISANSKGSVWLSLVSLFPPTYHNRPNGNRIDLMQKLADLHPGFLRFPGGNYLEGDTVAERFDWKKTIGPLEHRPGHQGPWGYRSSDGLGLLEFLDWCEDLHMQPVLAVYAGYSLRGEHVAVGNSLQPFVQDALDEIEYCTGDGATTWGKRRAADGHPEPFTIQYVEIGNEDWFDRSGSYDARFTQFYDALKAKYPSIQCIATTNVKSRTPDIYDDHSYPTARRMLQSAHRYDDRDPTLPKVLLGEWATQNGRPTPTLRGALADAAWLTSLQRDAAAVIMNCYATMLANVNNGAWQWSTSLIGYDAATSFGSTSYCVQKMFRENQGDTVLPVKLVAPDIALPPPPTSQGAIGLGTWRTSAEYKDLKVTSGNQTLFQSNFSQNLNGWFPQAGNWNLSDGSLIQPDSRHTDRITAGDKNWEDYTVTVKARKIAGREGFLVLFHVHDNDNYLWFNVAGWSNTRCAVEQTEDGDKNEIGTASPFSVEPNKWYDLRVEIHDNSVKCYVDDKLLAEVPDISERVPTESLFAAASRENSTGDVILKVVNTAPVAQSLQINLAGVKNVDPIANIETLTGQPTDVNTVDTPTRVIPQSATISDAGTTFAHAFPAYSVSVIRLKTK